MLRRYLFDSSLISFLYLAALLLLGGVAVITNSSLNEVRQDTRVVFGTQEIILNTERLLSAAKEVESAHRAYLLTGRSEHLDVAANARQRIGELTGLLKAAVSHAPTERQRLNTIVALITDRSATLEALARTRQSQGLRQLSTMSQATLQGEVTMQHLQREVNALQTDIRQMSVAQYQEVTDSTRQTYLLQLVGLGCGVGLLVLTFFGMRFQIRQRENDLRLIEKYNDRLEAEVRTRTAELKVTNEELQDSNLGLNASLEEQELIRQELEAQQRRLSRAYGLIEAENERKTRELAEASHLQLAMLPKPPPSLPGVDLAMRMQTATEVGGDYYDYQYDEGSRALTVALGDATGHGFRAGIVVATVKSYFVMLANRLSPREILRYVSEGVHSLQLRNMYVGLTVLRYHQGKLSVASSGMPPLLLYRREGHCVENLRLKGLFLGSNLRNDLIQHETTVQPGDVLLLHSDGLLERRRADGEQLGEQRLTAIYRRLATNGTAQEIVDGLMAEGQQWAGQPESRDDISLVALRFC